MATVQSVRFGETVIKIRTVEINGIACLRWDDIIKQLPTASALCTDNEQIPFLYDENGNDLQPVGSNRPDNQDYIYDMLDRILANTEEALIQLKNVMRQMYELHEYTTPRYFFILPAKQDDFNITDSVKNLFFLHFKLYFLCECSDDPKKLHVAPHEGYSIKKPQEFITKYGPYIVTTLSVARTLLKIGRLDIPLVSHVSATIKALLPENAEGIELIRRLDIAKKSAS